MSVKTTRIIDLNLFSGSSELLRQVAGGYFGDLEKTGDIAFNEADINSISNIESSDVTDIEYLNNSMLHLARYANRLYVDASAGFVSDEQWRAFVIGGTYIDDVYSGLYNEKVYSDHANTSSLPYVPREIVNISEDVLYPSLELATEYFNFYPRFQGEVDGLDKIIEAPNYYFLPSSYLAATGTPNSSVAGTSYLEMEDFLTDIFINSEKSYDEMQENLFILNPGEDTIYDLASYNVNKDNDLLTGYVDSDMQKLYSLMPFGNKLHIASDLANTPRNVYRTIIENNDFKPKFIKLLKETFQGESGLQTSTVNFAVNTESVRSTGTLTGSFETTTTIPVKVVDAPTMLLYSYKNSLSETNNIAVLNSSSYEEQLDYAMDTTGIYRYENTSASLGVLNQFVLTANNRFKDPTKIYPVDRFLNMARESKYYETVAFRIEKIGGPPTGDARTENTIQNIWFYNNNQALTYLDTQVKYGTEYTYKVYKYDIVEGYKYQLSDVLTTRQIALTASGETNIYCLEFYDPFTGQASPQLLEQRQTEAELMAVSSSLATQRDDLIRQNELTLFALDDEYDDNVIDYVNRKGANAANPSRGTDYLKGGGSGGPLAGPIFYDTFFQFYSSVFTKVNAAGATLKKLLDTDLDSNEDYFTKISDLVEQRLSGDLVVADPSISSEAAILDNLIAAAFREDVFTLFDANLRIIIIEFINKIKNDYDVIREKREDIELLSRELREIDAQLLELNSLATNAQINSSYPYLVDFNINIEPSLKIIEIPIEEKSMRILDHPPNDFVVTPHYLLDQTDRLAFYCKYDTFSMNTVTYPPTLNERDKQNKSSYLTGRDMGVNSKLSQESVSKPRYLEVYRTTTKPKSYEDFSGNLRTTIDLLQNSGDIPTDHLFLERVRQNTIYYYAFRSLNENRVAGQMSPVFESELVNDGGYTYGRFEQYTEDDLATTEIKEPFLGVKKLFNIIPNMQHMELDSSNADLKNSSSSEIDNISLGSSNVIDPLFSSDTDRYFKIRLTSKKTGRKIDINIGFKKEVRK